MFAATQTERVYHWLVKHDEETLGTVWSIEPWFTPDIVPADERLLEDLLGIKKPNAKHIADGETFYHLAHDGAGGVFLLWPRSSDPSQPPAVVYITSDGGYGVVTKSFLEFPHILAHGVSFSPYSDPPSVQPWHRELNSNFHKKKFEVLLQFEETTVERFGPLPPLEELASGRNEMNTEFRDWVNRSSIQRSPRRPIKRKRGE